MDWFYDAEDPSQNTEEALHEAIDRIALWWGLTNHEFEPTYGVKDGAAASTHIGYPALKDEITVNPNSDLNKAIFHEMAHIALEPALSAIQTLVEPYLPHSAADSLESLIHDMFEDFVQKLDRAVDAARTHEKRMGALAL